jgi:sugar/nucleoside kinase (ribokinase family)
VVVLWTKSEGTRLSRFDVTLAGEANLDLMLYGLPENLPADRELIADGMALTLGGSPAITAHNLAALGSRTGFITAASDDLFTSICASDLSTAGVDLSRVVRQSHGASTGVSILLQHPNWRRTLTYPGNTFDLRFEDLDLEYLASSQHFHLSSYFLQKGLRKDVPRLFAYLKRAGLTISVDPNDDPLNEWGDSFLEILRYVDVLMPNEREVCAMMRDLDTERAISSLASMVPLLIVKRGSRGALAIAGELRCEMEAISVASVDAFGAGDSFNADFLHAFLKGRPLELCLKLGNLTGAYSTTAQGGVRAFWDLARLDQFLSAHLSADENAVAARSEA